MGGLRDPQVRGVTNPPLHALRTPIRPPLAHQHCRGSERRSLGAWGAGAAHLKFLRRAKSKLGASAAVRQAAGTTHMQGRSPGAGGAAGAGEQQWWFGSGGCCWWAAESVFR